MPLHKYLLQGITEIGDSESLKSGSESPDTCDAFKGVPVQETIVRNEPVKINQNQIPEGCKIALNSTSNGNLLIFAFSFRKQPEGEV